VDPQRGLYVDVTSGKTAPIAEAMSDGRILVERVSTTKSAAKTQSIGIITLRTETDTREYSVSTAVDTTTGQTVAGDEVEAAPLLFPFIADHFSMVALGATHPLYKKPYSDLKHRPTSE